MNPANQYKFPVSNLLLLLGAAISIMLAGTEEVWAIVAFLAAAGAALVLLRPIVRPAGIPLVLLPLFCCLLLLAFLPQDFFPVPEWRRSLVDLGVVPLADSVNPQPWLGWFWWWLLVGTCLVAFALLSTPLATKHLALVLHAAALFPAAYACLAVLALQTGWHYPFHGGAVFGFLPNRNHTATLLVVGAVLSFGLMQWRLSRGDKAAAGFAALCGAPSLAALLFLSMSRAGVVFMILGFGIWALGASRGPFARKQILAMMVMLAVFTGLLFVSGRSVVRDRLVALVADTVANGSEGGGRDVDFRLPIFRASLRMIGDSPWTGIGVGQFEYVFPQYRTDFVRAANVLHPESDWLMVAAESGIASAVVLAGLLVWFVVVVWNSRSASGGGLRWTAASAVLAAALHGAIDVPWHRPSLGWFLVVVAASSVPASGFPLRAPKLGRMFFVLGGLALLAGSCWMAAEKIKGRAPEFYRWDEISAELERLGTERRFSQGEMTAAQAVKRFPLRYQAYYWHAGYLCSFEDTDEEIYAAIRAGRAVEPLSPQVPAEQAFILRQINPDAALDAWQCAIERSLAIDKWDGRADAGSSGPYVARALAAFQDDRDRQVALGRGLAATPLLLAHWIVQADPGVVAAIIPEIVDAEAFLEALPPKLRRQVLSRWCASTDAPRVVSWMEGREAVSSDLQYWPVLARYYASQGDLPRAVRRVASSSGISLDVPRGGDAGLRGQMATLIAEGNTVAARRIANDSLVAPTADTEALAAAMSYFASQEDWASAWRAASRLANEAKVGP
ncbi:MAG: O-antigen ligase family protein [Chthoniobacterales bacterium]